VTLPLTDMVGAGQLSEHYMCRHRWASLTSTLKIKS
jgi:hypothetical protein